MLYLKTAEHIQITTHIGDRNIGAYFANKVCFAQADGDELEHIYKEFEIPAGKKRVKKFYGEDARKIALLFSDIDKENQNA